MRLLAIAALFVCSSAFADSKCPGPNCPEKYEKPKVETVAEKCPGPGCPEKQNKTAAKPAKKSAAKQDWGHFSSGAKKDQKAMAKKKADKKADKKVEKTEP